MLDVRCLEFSNGVLAASALFHFSSLELVENVSGKFESHTQTLSSSVTFPSHVWLHAAYLLVYPSVRAALKWLEVEQCVRWMEPFAKTLREVGSSAMKSFEGISADDMHNIQTHASYMTWLVRPKNESTASRSNAARWIVANLEDIKIIMKLYQN